VSCGSCPCVCVASCADDARGSTNDSECCAEGWTNDRGINTHTHRQERPFSVAMRCVLSMWRRALSKVPFLRAFSSAPSCPHTPLTSLSLSIPRFFSLSHPPSALAGFARARCETGHDVRLGVRQGVRQGVTIHTGETVRQGVTADPPIHTCSDRIRDDHATEAPAGWLGQVNLSKHHGNSECKTKKSVKQKKNTTETLSVKQQKIFQNTTETLSVKQKPILNGEGRMPSFLVDRLAVCWFFTFSIFLFYIQCSRKGLKDSRFVW